ncbi:unnamed protein product [Ixodes persulcatus]
MHTSLSKETRRYHFFGLLQVSLEPKETENRSLGAEIKEHCTCTEAFCFPRHVNKFPPVSWLSSPAPRRWSCGCCSSNSVLAPWCVSSTGFISSAIRVYMLYTYIFASIIVV